VLSRAPGALARAIATLARERTPQVAGNPAMLARFLATKLERIAARAIEERTRDRSEVVKDIGLAVVGSDPEVHPPLFLEEAGPSSEHAILKEAVETLPPSALGELVAIHYPRMRGDVRDLNHLLDRTTAWQMQRQAALDATQQRLRALGSGTEEIGDLVDRLLWNEVDNTRRLDLLYKDNSLWHMDFSRLKVVLVELLDSGQMEKAGALARKFMSGLMAPDLAVRLRVARGARNLFEILEGRPAAKSLLQWIGDIVLTRLPDEKDGGIAKCLSDAVASLGDRLLRSGEFPDALDLMRRAERLVESKAPSTQERGRVLLEAMGRAGDVRTTGSLLEAALHGDPKRSSVAVEILERGRVPHLLEKMAVEEDRSRRSELVKLLKRMSASHSAPFVSYLKDRRWYVVRNVVAILASTGDRRLLAEMDVTARHADARVRKEVVRAFLQLGSPECEDRIVKATTDADARVQIAAVNALVALKGKRALDALVAVVRAAGPYANTTSEVRQEAVLGLGKLGKESAVPILTDIATRKGLLGYAETTELRIAAAKALGMLGTPEARAVLEDLAAEDSRSAVREAASHGARKGPSPG
jgi:HEAT repeat protein